MYKRQVDHLCSLLVVGGKVVGGYDYGILDKGVGMVGGAVGLPFFAAGQNHIGNGIESIQHFRPLVQQVGIGNDQQNPAASLQPLLIDDQHGLVALAPVSYTHLRGYSGSGGMPAQSVPWAATAGQ